MASEFTALLASISVALFAVYGWLGLRYSTPLTATIVSLAAHTATLGAAVALTGAIRRYAQVALMVFVFLGLQKVGASRSQPLRNSYPLWSAALAIAFMDEYAGLALLGALLTLVALASGRVMIVSPIVATTPLFSLIISLVFLRGKEPVTGKTILGTIAVVFGTIAIALGK